MNNVQQAVQCFLMEEDYKKGNTEVSQSIMGTHLYLHGNEIARMERDYIKETTTYSITNAGWDTNTTNERLRAIPGVQSIVHKKGELYLNGEKWDGGWTIL